LQPIDENFHFVELEQSESSVQISVQYCSVDEVAVRWHVKPQGHVEESSQATMPPRGHASGSTGRYLFSQVVTSRPPAPHPGLSSQPQRSSY
jgi:hypothetical protein